MKYTLTILLLLTGCATPMMMLEKDGAHVVCGGGTAGSTLGGVIGYRIQEGHDRDCIKEYESQGYKVVKQEVKV